MSGSLRITRSAHNPRVTLITSTSGTDPSAQVTVKPEPRSPDQPSSSSYTSLRRTTRALASASGSEAAPSTDTKKDLARYALEPSTPSPRKKPRLATPLVKIEPNIDDGSIASPKTPRSSKKPLPLLALDKPHPAPPRWEEQYRLIEHMRKGIVAPVDNMGCERPRTIVDNDPKTVRFHILISLMLSSQTKDPVTSQAVSNLHDTLPGGLTAQSLADASIETVQECINKVGFWRRKTDYIREAARKLLEREGEEKGDVPKTLEGLCELKGVGPKMAFLALQCAWDVNAGIGVDVHVHRISNRLRWHKPPTTNPEATRLNLQSWLPSNLHKAINPLLVGFGQVICQPVGPRCDICLLGQKKICPSRVANVNAQGRKEVQYTFKSEEEEEAKPKVEIGYEAGLVRIKDEDERDGGVKMERDEVGIDGMLEHPGMSQVEEVLGVLDQVDGARGIDGEVLERHSVKEEL
ncbi:hypothetical protein IAU60_001183 [Kwoniella sp. DSM 27419]